MQESISTLRLWFPWAQAEPSSQLVAARVATFVGDWNAGSRFTYHVEDRVSGALVGATSLNDRHGPGIADVGGWVRVGFEHRGYAREVLSALTDAAFELGMEHVITVCDVANVRSADVPQSLGFELVAQHPTETTAPGERGLLQQWEMTSQVWDQVRPHVWERMHRSGQLPLGPSLDR